MGYMGTKGLCSLLFFLLRNSVFAFVPTSVTTKSTSRTLSNNNIVRVNGYVKPEAEAADDQRIKRKKLPLYPKVGDIVRYYDLDGGKNNAMVGMISFIQQDLSIENGWKLELNEMEDLGEGYFADYWGRKRLTKKALRLLPEVAPVAASFVRSEGAYKVPLTAEGIPIPRQETYDLEGFQGFAGSAIDETVVAADGMVYSELKSSLLRNVGITALAGTVLANLLKGPEIALIYGVGALSGIAYLLLLFLKTDTIAKDGSKDGNGLSNLRFFAPALVLGAVALYNKSLGDGNPMITGGEFSLVTLEQFAAAILGFLTYRLPLLSIQVKEAVFRGDMASLLPGSAGVALQLARKEEESETNLSESEILTTVLLVSGPQATGRSDLVEKLIAKSEGELVRPDLIDRSVDGAKFERLEQREELLWVDPSGRYGLTREGIVNAVSSDSGKVIVVDADVTLAKKLTSVGGIRIVGAWVGLNSMGEFESRLGRMIDDGEIKIEDGDSRESVIRGRIREIVKELEYGISSGVFEFTVLNQNEETSLKELQSAASYCFK